MQTRKDNIRIELLRAGRREFVAKGFKDASMRAIAREANVSLSNIYNYFESKDDLFVQVLKPTMEVLERVLDDPEGEANVRFDLALTDLPRRLTHVFTELLWQHRAELEILLYRAHGSVLEGFKEALVERHMQAEREGMRRLKARYPQLHIDFSEFFFHTMSSWWINTIGELVTHDLTREELEAFLAEYMEFGTAGWKRVMGVD